LKKNLLENAEASQKYRAEMDSSEKNSKTPEKAPKADMSALDSLKEKSTKWI